MTDSGLGPRKQILGPRTQLKGRFIPVYARPDAANLLGAWSTR